MNFLRRVLPSDAKYDAWADEGFPARWAFWRARDEFDGLWIGVALGCALTALCLLLSLLV